MENKYYIKGEPADAYIMYGNEIESVYIAHVMSYSYAVEMVERLNKK